MDNLIDGYQNIIRYWKPSEIQKFTFGSSRYSAGSSIEENDNNLLENAINFSHWQADQLHKTHKLSKKSNCIFCHHIYSGDGQNHVRKNDETISLAIPDRLHGKKRTFNSLPMKFRHVQD
ncbi:hypothetical protein JTB14_034713 [Gonioctena quinquepunctata]|nr:hypothetical protein JTB14_034713 [Gonioctena quinquepunctata]